MNQYQYTALKKMQAPQWLFDKIEKEQNIEEKEQQLCTETEIAEKASDFAKEIGVSRQYISAILNGTMCNERIEKILLEWKNNK